MLKQRQHTLIAVALATAGIAELLHGSANGAIWAYVWPAALLVIGALFLTHTQHGTGEAVARAVRLHRVLGITVMAAGLLRAIEVSAGGSAWGTLWPLLLLAAAAQLLIYHEPEGAFESVGGHGSHD